VRDGREGGKSTTASRLFDIRGNYYAARIRRYCAKVRQFILRYTREKPADLRPALGCGGTRRKSIRRLIDGAHPLSVDEFPPHPWAMPRHKVREPAILYTPRLREYAFTFAKTFSSIYCLSCEETRRRRGGDAEELPLRLSASRPLRIIYAPLYPMCT
jgi:hypothetical protein